MASGAREQAHSLPENPGCYLMKDKSGTVIYVGKAKNLKRRVSSYFLPNRNVKTAALVEKIDSIDFVITGNEYEALILENNLIKKYNPHYNILLKDGKSYPVIRIANEPFPRISKTRRIIKDGSKYYGPYPDGQRLKLYLEMTESMYPLRRCEGKLRKRDYPCLYYHLKKCSGPCIGAVSEEEYGGYVKEVEKFLDGDDASMIHSLTKEMEKKSKAMDYEAAAVLRDQIKALKVMQENQNVQDEDSSEEGRDYVAIETRGMLSAVAIMQFRSGRLIGKAIYRAECLGDDTESLLSFLVEYYSDGESLPSELYVSCEIDFVLLSRYFSETFGSKLKVDAPRDGKHFRILRMASENARRDIEKRMREIDNSPALTSLGAALGLESNLEHIEGFDIAQLSGKHTVASLIVFRGGNPSPREYRHFSMKSLEEGQIDDYRSIAEAVYRRYKRQMEEKAEMPDLLLIDGGIGQVHAALDSLDELGVMIPVVGLAKREEEIVFPDGSALLLDKADPALRVLIAVRDECHRFATSFNQRMRSKDASFALLESIEGVGKARSRSIMMKYGSADAILALNPEELASGAKIPLAVAERILRKLNF